MTTISPPRNVKAIAHVIVEVPRYFLGAPVVLLREESETPQG